jgi:hypothetical protein
VNRYLNDIKRNVCIFLPMQVVPSLKPDLTSMIILENKQLIRLSTGFRFFESKTFTMYSWSSFLSDAWFLRVAIQNPIASQTTSYTASFALERP